MRYRITLILFIVSAILCIWIYSLENGGGGQKNPASETSGLFGPDILLADRLELRGPALGEGEERVLKKKGSDQWFIEKPMNWPANYYIVNQILNQIQFLPKEYSFTVESILKVGKTLTDYGLQEPRLELTLGWEDMERSVSFGLPSEMGGRTYLLGPDRQNIYAVSQQLENSLLQGLEFWQSPEIFTLPVIEVSSMSLDINDDGNLTKIRLEKTGDDWKLEAPIKAPADSHLVNERINALQGVKALGFLSGKAKQEAEEALLKPLIRITLSGASQGQTLELAETLEDSNPFLCARFDSYPTTYFLVSAEPFRNLRRAQTFFRQKKFTDFSIQQVSSVSIEGSNKQVNLQKLERGDWQVQEPGETRWIKAENSTIVVLLDILSHLEAISFPYDAPSQEDLQRLGLENPIRVVTLQISNEPTPITLLFGQPESGEALYAKMEDVPYIYEVQKTLIDILRTQHIYYRDRRLFPDNTLPAEATLKRLIISPFPEGEPIINFPEKKPLAEDEPTNSKESDSLTRELEVAREALILGLADNLRNLRVREFTSKAFQENTFSGPDGDVPWAFDLEATYNLPEGNDPEQHTLSLKLTERISGSEQGAGHKETGNAFLLRQQTIDLLYRILPNAEPPPEYRAPPKPAPDVDSREKPPAP